MADDTTSEADLTGEPTAAEATAPADQPAAELTPEQKKAAKAAKATEQKKAKASTAAAKPGKAPDGLPLGEGNRDDGAELDLGVRTAAMGPLPGQLVGPLPETADEKVARLERENRELRAGLDSLVPEEARRVLNDRAKVAADLSRAAWNNFVATVAPIPGTGPALWIGSIEGVPLIPPVTFRGSDNEAEAREQFLVHAGVQSTTGKVLVARQGE